MINIFQFLLWKSEKDVCIPRSSFLGHLVECRHLSRSVYVLIKKKKREQKKVKFFYLKRINIKAR